MADRAAAQRGLTEIDPTHLVDLVSALIRIPSFNARGDYGGPMPGILRRC